MSIKGLTDRGMQFPQIGNIRKGDKSGTNGAPKDLQYFRVEFDEKEAEAAAAFALAYPDNKPTEINIFLPFNEIDRCWDAWCEAYTAGSMIGRSDGEYFMYFRAGPNVVLAQGMETVINGTNAKGERLPHREVVGQAGKTVIKCRPVGRLKVLVPELRRLAYLVVHTTSVIDIRNLSEQLEAIKQINGGQIVGVPLVLKRRPKQISVPNADGTKRRLTKWMLSIEADPRWVTEKIAQLDRLALPEGSPRLALPAVAEDIPEDDNQVDGETQWVDEPDEAGEWQPQDEQTEEADPAMSYEEACTVTDKRGKFYKDAPDNILVSIVDGIEKDLQLPSLTQEQTDLLRRRLEAANVILAHRTTQS